MKRHIGELDAITRQYRVDDIRHGRDQVTQELGDDHLTGLRAQLDESEPAGAVDRHEEAQFAFGGLHLSDVDMEIAD